MYDQLWHISKDGAQVVLQMMAMPIIRNFISQFERQFVVDTT